MYLRQLLRLLWRFCTCSVAEATAVVAAAETTAAVAATAPTNAIASVTLATSAVVPT